jgi:CspA family cold shock protein
MVFRDQRLTCEECGRTFFFTVTEQRRLAEQTGTEQVEAPALCPQCRDRSQAGQVGSQTRADIAPSMVEKPGEPVEETTRPGVEQAVDMQIEEAFPLEEEGVQVKLIGTVKWFSRDKGYGFITKADGKDLFFHRADLSKDEHGWPQEGEKVEFQIRQTAKGPEAFNVSILPSD